MKEELKADFNILDARHLHTFEIPFALPKLESPSNTMQFDVDAKTIEAGDFLLNGSQNAACKVGEELADYILKDAKCLN
ncbi:hypothetical protein CW751_13340 [Brumimicrobium salinarum]|uniref:Uncharacterized protein n=1 Tax=Brumimicrobium salinarum TaxID=2058658 RepID=A0A2I0QZQ6_9FLAO|nr:hypothetical protein [Brumimicrobium salinarum]PKR79808.1 hypothetical protein CW751_13340 [Brumimicrobium salinarum]